MCIPHFGIYGSTQVCDEATLGSLNTVGVGRGAENNPLHRQTSQHYNDPLRAEHNKTRHRENRNEAL